MSQISALLGPGLDRDIETVLMQMRSVMDVPTDDSLFPNIYRSSARDYVFPTPQTIASPKSYHITTLPAPCFLFPPDDERDSRKNGFLDALSELKKHSQTMRLHDPQRSKDSLVFLVQPLSYCRFLLIYCGFREIAVQNYDPGWRPW
jgi:hypothetical protein